MRKFYENKNSDTEDRSEVKLSPMDCSIFAPDVVGERYKKRLNEIWARRNVTRGPNKLRLAF
jgi:hypothetical protein